MAKFEIQYANNPVNVQSTAAYARPQTAAYEAIAQTGQAIFQIGKKLQQQKDELEYSEGQRRIAEYVNSATNSLTGDEISDKQIWEKLQQDIGGIEYDNARVNSALEVYRNTRMPAIQQSLTERHKGLLQRNIRDQFEAEGQTLLAKGDLIGYQTVLDRRFASQEISQAEYQSLSKSALSDSLIEQARDLVASDNGADQMLAKKMLTTIPQMKGIELKTEQKEYLQKLLSISKRKSDQLSEESNKQLTDLMLKGTLSNDDVMQRRNELNDTDYQSWAKIALSPVDKRGNIIEATQLKTLAIDVWRGSLSRTEAEAKIRESLASPNGINDKQYAAIYDDLNREVKAYQAQDMKSYSIEATRLILGKDSNVMSFDSLGNMTIDLTKLLSPQTDFEKKMHYIDLYNKEMSDYLSENPKASKKEIYVKSKELRATYLAASKGQTTPTQKDVVRITSDEDWLKLETGQRFVGPDGVERTK